jgi:hypothetical protein
VARRPSFRVSVSRVGYRFNSRLCILVCRFAREPVPGTREVFVALVAHLGVIRVGGRGGHVPVLVPGKVADAGMPYGFIADSRFLEVAVFELGSHREGGVVGGGEWRRRGEGECECVKECGRQQDDEVYQN